MISIIPSLTNSLFLLFPVTSLFIATSFSSLHGVDTSNYAQVVMRDDCAYARPNPV